MSLKRIYPITESKPVVESNPVSQDWESHRNDSIIIDNGSTTLRAGWSTEDSPRIVADNVASKYRERKTNKLITLAGSEVYVDSTSRSFMKSPFEGDIVTNFDQMETMLDFVFYKLGIQSETIEHPIVMSETLCNPYHSRALMSELLFEGYNVPSLTYSVDSLSSFYQNSPTSTGDGLIISSSTSGTHVIPVLGGKGIPSSAKRLAWGGSQASEYFLKLMQLKYPTFPGRLSNYQSASMYREHSYFALDYTEEIRSLADSKTMAQMGRIVQFPFVTPVVDEKSEEDLARQAEKKKEAGRRLQAQAVNQRLEKMVRQEEELATFTELKSQKGIGRKADYDKKLKAVGFKTIEELDTYVKKIEKSLRTARNKELGVDENEGKELPTFPLVNVPDHTLNEEDLKEKRRQRLMKAGYDARIRAKAEREVDKARLAEEKRIDEERRRDDMGGWLREVRKEHEIVILKMKEKKKLKEQLSDRKSLAAQNRMKSIANLASEAGTVGKKRKRGEKDDDFGKNDDDWAVYREIGNGDDSDEEDDEQANLQEIEARLLEYDPDFTLDHTAERLALRKHQLINAFVRGLSPDDPLDTYDPESLEHNSQLHLNVERIRVPEVLFQPHLAGLDQAGLGEIVEHVLKGFSSSDRNRLTSNIFVTGGNTLIPNFDLRLHNSLRPILSVDSTMKIVRPFDLALDSWRGMAKWSRSGTECASSMVTRAEFNEYGGDYFKYHSLGNS